MRARSPAEARPRRRCSGPGYLIDSCSTGHTLIQTNPLLIDDELDLIGRYGLTYIEPDPFSHVAFPDGEQLTMWLDRERSVEELARFSRADAERTSACSTTTTRSSTCSEPRASPHPDSARRSRRCSPTTPRARSGAGG